MLIKLHTSESYQQFRNTLLKWFKKHQREMPWRGIDDPYKIWISEVMLQQTQVKKVVAYYERFITKFPNVHQLAAAQLQDVLKVWEGLGYYARARNLHKAAQIIVKEYNGEITNDYAAFRKLPGIGDYSAAAVQSIAYNEPYAAVDGNIKRVLARLFQMDSPINDSTEAKHFQHKANQLLDKKEPGQFNQAMMELGATVCRPQSPTCLVCPVNVYCGSFQTARQDEFPIRKKSEKVQEHHIAAGVIYKGDKVLIVQRPNEGLLGGLWEFPNGQINDTETAEQGCIRHISELVHLSVSNMKYLNRVKHAFTHFKIVVDAFQCEYSSGDVVLNGPIDAKWVALSELKDYPLPRATHKLLETLIQ